MKWVTFCGNLLPWHRGKWQGRKLRILVCVKYTPHGRHGGRRRRPAPAHTLRVLTRALCHCSDTSTNAGGARTFAGITVQTADSTCCLERARKSNLSPLRRFCGLWLQMALSVCPERCQPLLTCSPVNDLCATYPRWRLKSSRRSHRQPACPLISLSSKKLSSSRAFQHRLTIHK